MCVFDLNADCLSENERYKDSAPMKRLLMCRQEEVKAVYHEKELVEVLLTMSRKLQEHVVGRCVCVCVYSVKGPHKAAKQVCVCEKSNG